MGGAKVSKPRSRAHNVHLAKIVLPVSPLVSFLHPMESPREKWKREYLF